MKPQIGSAVRFIMLNVNWTGTVVYIHKDPHIGDILSVAVGGYSETIKVPSGQCVLVDHGCYSSPMKQEPEPQPPAARL